MSEKLKYWAGEIARVLAWIALFLIAVPIFLIIALFILVSLVNVVVY